MRGSTHLALGLSAAVLTGQPWYGMAAAGLGAVLPDIDEPGSVIGSKVPGSALGRVGRAAFGGALLGTLISYFDVPSPLVIVFAVGWLVLAFIPHRGFTHSLLALALAWMGARALLPGAALPFAAGYALHLAADALTPHGVPLLWPWPKTIGVPLVRTNGWIDRLAGFGAWMFILWRSLKWGGLLP